jgi:oligoribonuclease (3'-5' exoribonuclease)
VNAPHSILIPFATFPPQFYETMVPQSELTDWERTDQMTDVQAIEITEVRTTRTYTVTVAKTGRGKDAATLSVAADFFDSLPDNAYQEILQRGLESYVNSKGMSKIKAADKGSRDAAIAVAEKNLKDLQEGNITRKTKAKVSGAEMTEAKRLARQAVKDALKEAGQKVSHYAASEITRLAVELIDEDPSFLAKARENLANRVVAKGIDLSKIKEDPKLVKAAEEKKAKAKKETLSATQAGMVKARAKSAQASAQH